MPSKPLVVFSILGSQLDRGKPATRWNKWRPTVDLCRHEELPVARLELLYQEKFASLRDTVIEDIGAVSASTSVVPRCMEWADPWDLEQVYGGLHDLARSYTFRPGREDYLVHINTGTHVAQICWFLLTESRHFPARIIQTRPPPASRKGEPGAYQIIDLDLSRYDRIAQRFWQERREGLSVLKAGIDTRNQAFNQMIEQVAVSSADPMLLTGPTGAGKSQLARRVYELKRARGQLSGPLVAVNCATIQGGAAMSALFGHVKGAFTGAAQSRPGHLKQADGGVLFLDEVGELGAEEQAMLLGAIEEKVFYPVGSDRPVRSDFQLIAGTNRDLRAEVAAGRFREDLLARIDLWTYQLPGLTDRPEDLEPNLQFELANNGVALNMNLTMTREAKSRFLRFARAPRATWRGNFRDFNGAVRRMATLCDGGRIKVKDVDAEIERLVRRWEEPSDRTATRVSRYLGARQAKLDRFDEVQLEEVLAVCERSRSLADAGQALFAVSRTRKKSTNDSDRLRKYLAKFGLAFADLQRP